MPAVHVAYLVMVIVAFLTFMVVLGGVSTYTRMAERRLERVRPRRLIDR